MNNTEQSYEDFISTVSHELRTPLTSIRGFSQTMLASWDKLDEPSKKKFIKIIEEQSQRLINLVENMLTVTKLQRENKSLIYTEFDAINSIEQAILLLKNQYKEHIFNIKHTEHLPKIFADKDKFTQIITNLLENSAKYSIQNNQTDIFVSSDASDINIIISNTGITIDKKDYNKIFTKFARIDNPLTRKVQGSGLGLYITKNLTTQMGGNIAVNSEQLSERPEYSKITFTLKFPIKNIEEQTKIKCNQ